MSTVIAKIAQVIQAYRACLKRSQEPLGGDAERWARRHCGALTDLETNHLPRGSGFDNGTKIDLELTTIGTDQPECIVFSVDFHVMNDAGYYVGWASFMVKVTPSFTGIDMEINQTQSTEDDAECDLGEHVMEILHGALMVPMEHIPSEYYSEN